MSLIPHSALRRWLAAALVGACLPWAGLQAHDQSAGALAFGHLWIKSVPGSPNGAMYVEITNTGMHDDRLIAARTHIAAKATLHTQNVTDGVARMRRAQGFDVPADGTIKLAPGGDHIMLMGLAGMFMDGEHVPVTLVFERAGDVSLQAVIEGMIHTSGTAGDGQGHHHD